MLQLKSQESYVFFCIKNVTLNCLYKDNWKKLQIKDLQES